MALILMKQEQIALLILLIVSIVCLTASAILAQVGKEPFSKPYTPGLPEGTLVSWTGMVDSVSQTQTGGHLILDLSGVNIFIPASAGLNRLPEVSERLSVIGTVQNFKGSQEIVVDAAADIRWEGGYQAKNLRS